MSSQNNIPKYCTKEHEQDAQGIDLTHFWRWSKREKRKKKYEIRQPLIKENVLIIINLYRNGR